MRTLLIQTVAVGYKHAVKPVLFRFSPDDVHDAMLKVASRLGKSSVVRGAASWTFLKQSPLLTQTVAGVAFASPVGVSAGFDKNADTVPMVATLGYGFMTVGSVTAEACAGNPRPWFHRLPKEKSLVVHVGLANHGSTRVLRRLAGYRQFLTKRCFPVVLSVAKTNSPKAVSHEAARQDYLTSLKRAAKSPDVSMIEINISCPNTYGGEPFTSPELLESLLAQVDALRIPQPLFVKMPVELPWQAFEALLDVVARHKVAGVTIANLVKDRKRLQGALDPAIRGGLSGKPTQAASNERIEKTYRKYGKKLIIIGVGGIFSAKDAYEKIRKGATLVELITGMIFNGPQLGAEINRGLVKLLKADGFHSIHDAIGVDVE